MGRILCGGSSTPVDSMSQPKWGDRDILAVGSKGQTKVGNDDVWSVDSLGI